MRTALVTGGAGFIGSHLTERLLKDGWEVLVLDDLSTGNVKNLDAVRGSKRLHITLDSIDNAPVVMELVDRAEAVFHLAAAVGVQLIVKDPVHTIETNIHGTEHILQCSAKKGKKFILASTSEVYGKGSKEKFSEGDDLVFGATTRSRWSYGCSKAIDEFLALAYCATRGMPAIIVRLFNTVGPRQVGHYGMVVPRFVKQALNGGPITVYGDGNQVRCFVHVDDVVDAVCHLTGCEKAVGQIFNVGSDQPVTINELAERVQKLVNPKVEILHIPYEDAYAEGFEDIRARVPDLTKIRETVSFNPTKSLDQILMDVKEYLLNEG